MKKHIFTLLLLLGLLSCSAVGQDAPKQLPRSTPQAENIDLKNIQSFLKGVTDANVDLHSLMIVRNGKVAYEEWFGDNAPDKNHVLNSVSKTFTAMAIGFAVQEKRLTVQDKVISFFPDDLPKEISENLAQLEIRHLLTMTVGIEEDPTRNFGNQTKPNWEHFFFESPVVHKPGTVFLYNSLATYMLSSIIQKVTGEKLVDYLTPRLFTPLGISGMTWESNPSGVNMGGWGLYVKTEDMAKLGQFLLQKGKWNNRQLLPEAWIEEATTVKIMQSLSGPDDSRGNSDWLQGYGYQTWRCRHNAFRADGAGGQFIVVLPEKNAVIVLTSNVQDMQGELNLVWNRLLPGLK